jgi:hypothetical protein
MKLYEICIIIMTVLVAGVAFKVTITDLTVFEKFRVKKVDINFRSKSILSYINVTLKNISKFLAKCLIYIKNKIQQQ